MATYRCPNHTDVIYEAETNKAEDRHQACPRCKVEVAAGVRATPAAETRKDTPAAGQESQADEQKRREGEWVRGQEKVTASEQTAAQKRAAARD